MTIATIPNMRLDTPQILCSCGEVAEYQDFDVPLCGRCHFSAEVDKYRKMSVENIYSEIVALLGYPQEPEVDASGVKFKFWCDDNDREKIKEAYKMLVMRGSKSVYWSGNYLAFRIGSLFGINVE